VTVPVHSPARASEDDKGFLARAIEARGRKFKVVDVSHLGLTLAADKPIAKIAFRVNVKHELNRAIVDAAKYVDGLAKGTSAATDEDLTRDAKTPYALWNACRAVDPDGNPTVMGVFPSPRWMLENLDNDEFAALLNIYNDVQDRTSPWPLTFTDDDVEACLTLCADGAGTEIPTVLLAGVERGRLAQYLILAACKLRKVRSELLAAQALLDLEKAEDAAHEEEPATEEEQPEDPSQ
jgi:hypothetical protein